MPKILQQYKKYHQDFTKSPLNATFSASLQHHKQMDQFMAEIKAKLTDIEVEIGSRMMGILTEKTQELDSILRKASFLIESLRKIDFTGPKGRDADEVKIITEVIKQIPKPKDGVSPVLPNLQEMVDNEITKLKMGLQIPKQEVTKIIREIERKFEPKDWAEQLAREFEKLPYAKKLDYITGLKNKPTLEDRVVGSKIKEHGGGSDGGLIEEIPTGAVGTGNKVFTFTKTPKLICVDGGRLMKPTSSDGTVNFTVSGFIATLKIGPVFDIIGFVR